MKTKLVLDINPTENNARNSEGSFLRAPNGDILFAYSHYGSGYTDHEHSDIAMIMSSDEGETWSEPRIIATAEELHAENLMSTQALYLKDGSLSFYFIIKEADTSSTIGRVVSRDGIHFHAERCILNCERNYYVLLNDRIVRLSDGRIVIPVSKHNMRVNPQGEYRRHEPARVYVMISEDDGLHFDISLAQATYFNTVNRDCGLAEPGLIELSEGVFYLWARTKIGRQYQFYSVDNFASFTPPEPSIFTSPESPLGIHRDGQTLYAVYNPIPDYDGRVFDRATAGRTPLVLRVSKDLGKTWGPLNTIEDDEHRGYCYPAMFLTKDNALLVAYCRGGYEDTLFLSRLGMSKIDLNTVEM